MEELFRLRIEAERKTTIPQHLLNLLRLREGDELRVVTEGQKLLRVESRRNGRAKRKSGKEKSDLLVRIEAIRAGSHDSEEELQQALQDVAIAAGSH
jgi:antitoxin component of MazEF toxin-antitoxin module